MNRTLRLTLLAVIVGICNATAQVNIDFPGGKIALSHDGNSYDKDDIAAFPMALAMVEAAGLQSQVVHIEHSINVCRNTTSQHEDMKISAQGIVDYFGYDPDLVFNYWDEQASAQAHLISVINQASASDPLWILAAGPMESIYRAMDGSNQENRAYVKIISHSNWNETFNDCTGARNWSDLVGDFSADDTEFIEIAGQNHQGFNSDYSHWYWLRDSSDPKYSWLYSRAQTNKFDVSDAGMAFYLLTGGPNNGCENCSYVQVQELFESNLDTTCSGNSVPQVQITSITPSDSIVLGDALTFTINASDSDGEISSVNLYRNDALLVSDGAAPYTLITTAESTGTQEYKIEAVDDCGAKASTLVELVVYGDEPDPTPGDYEITKVKLIDALNDLPLFTINPGMVINLYDLPSGELNIEAFTNPSEVGSVQFNLNGQIKTEGVAPYSFYGDKNGDYKSWIPDTGEYNLEVTAYSERGASGQAGLPYNISFSIINDSTLADDSNPTLDTTLFVLILQPEPFEEFVSGEPIQFLVNHKRSALIETMELFIDGSLYTSIPADELGYTFFEDLTFTIGTHTVQAKALKENTYNLTEEITFSILDQESPEDTDSISAVSSLVLINPDSDSILFVMSDGDQYSLEDLPTYINIEAITSPQEVGSVRFSLILTDRDSIISITTENVSPYAMFGDSRGDYRSVYQPAPGNYVLSATPFSEKSGNGEMGNAHTINFTILANSGTRKILEESVSISIRVYPNPLSSSNKLHISGLASEAEKLRIQMVNIGGQVFEMPFTNENGVVVIDHTQLSHGLYTLIVTASGKSVTSKVIIR